MNLKEQIINKIKDFLSERGVQDPKVILDYPAHIKMGDLSSNVAMVYAKELGEKPMDLAEKIRQKIDDEKIYVQIAAPGFLNFSLPREHFRESVEREFFSDLYKNQKIIIEYTDPNPFKEFHIGHLMPNVIGESIARILEANGADLKRANYQGDLGLHVAKAVWAMVEKDVDLKDAYAFGHKAYEENEESKKEIIEINKNLYDGADTQVNEAYEKGRRESLIYFEVMYAKLGTKFDHYFFESEVAQFGKEIVEKNIGPVFEQSEGAVVFRGENFDKKLHTRVFINKESLPTYEAKELALAKVKYDAFAYDTSIVVTGNEINEYFKVLLKAMSLVFPDLAQKTKHISHGMLRLPEGKMSSRTGNIISAESLINQVKERIKMRIDDEKIAEEISIAAIKYSILRQAIGGDIIFDFDKSISFEGDSGPYLQYSAVRANSLLKKSVGEVVLSYDLPEGWETTNLEKYLERFPSIVEKAGREYAPHHIVTYLIELASEFNSFYGSHKIIDQQDKTSPYRLALTKSFDNVMTKGLDLLGIKVPERM